MAFFVEVVDSNDKHLKFDECGGTTVDACLLYTSDAADE